MIRNFIFSIFFFIGIIIISLIFLPAFFLPQKVVLFGGKLMGYWTSFCLKFLLATKIIIKGKENILNNEKFFIAASHQSMFETFYLQTIFCGKNKDGKNIIEIIIIPVKNKIENIKFLIIVIKSYIKSMCFCLFLITLIFEPLINISTGLGLKL